jgi:hypothetical protein
MMLSAIPESAEDESNTVERTAGDNTNHPPLASISESLGWYFPKVKLASWNPEDEKQWAVRLMCDTMVLPGWHVSCVAPNKIFLAHSHARLAVAIHNGIISIVFIERRQFHSPSELNH